jgi:formate hydrogenlyase transcriptional activator
MTFDPEILDSKILIIDDEPVNVRLVEQMLKMHGFTCLESSVDPHIGVEMYLSLKPDLVLLDLLMPKMSGFEVLEEIKKIEGGAYPPVLVLTALADEKTRFKALEAGARDFLTKPMNQQEVLCRIRNLLEIRLLHKRIKEHNLLLEKKVEERTADLLLANNELEVLQKQLQNENAYLRDEVTSEFDFEGIIGNSPSMQEVLKKIKQVAGSNSTVLIQGETGTGKELIARAIHEQSKRKKRALVKVNCGGIPRELFESEFFGHLKGAFTGAIKDRIGRFQLADKGTLFLDEVGEIPIELQPKLLRVLQEGEFEPIGEDRTRNVDVRIIAATNRDLKEETLKERFREDLYYRLDVFPIHVPPLRDRKEDIERIANFFIKDHSCRLNLKTVCLSEENIRDLDSYDWPGNIRELQNVIERALITAQDGVLNFDLRAKPNFLRRSTEEISSKEPLPIDDVFTAKEEKDRNRNNIIAALQKSNWKVYGSDGAAKILGLHPQTLSNKMKKLEIKKPN